MLIMLIFVTVTSTRYRNWNDGVGETGGLADKTESLYQYRAVTATIKSDPQTLEGEYRLSIC